jgi:hypothetical protein
VFSFLRVTLSLLSRGAVTEISSKNLISLLLWVVVVATGVATWFLPELSGFMLEQLDKAAMISKAGIRGLNIFLVLSLFNGKLSMVKNPACRKVGEQI